ncbi:hypothetical protein [Rhodopseudomonas palustris]|uniref:Uncharacterized protein n=1 Tax=Rhodopseudomonas palustris (strain ATCC BAA-98 / CGA009) TaxID=258594 RepID=A0AAF0BQ16_RHOPA|nr:hypothetical protein [Rhodopseudomonas palustris]WAB79539.1 hypothetical protein OR798_09660 [Rhodopseudomonas palustris]WCL92023.1 hypothetical protein TX73_009655 [Rhodopseudomonas palustris CGA009]WND53434.1 hypothetical protein L1A21_09625 [Rhodopseudomonas palustris]
MIQLNCARRDRDARYRTVIFESFKSHELIGDDSAIGLSVTGRLDDLPAFAAAQTGFAG